MSEKPRALIGPTRKVIAVAATSNPFGDGSVTEVLYAVCDDGSMWRYPTMGALDPNNNPPEWRQIPDVPQTTKEGDA